MELADLIRLLQAVLADAEEHVGEKEAGKLIVEFKDGARVTHPISDVRMTKVHVPRGSGEPEAIVWLEN